MLSMKTLREYNVNINGIDVNAHYGEETIRSILLPLLHHLTNLQREKHGRILVFLAAPPGAGKSTLCSFLEVLSHEYDDICDVQAIGMDGFHRRQEYLLSHSTIRDGEEVRMVDIKGAPVTFDLDKLTESVERVAKGMNCPWPSYDRHLHNPVENAYEVTGDVVILEGNYLLLDEYGWRDLKNYADYTIFLSGDEQMLRDRLIERKILSGNSREDAVNFVDFSDMANVRLCLEKSMKADMELDSVALMN